MLECKPCPQGQATRRYYKVELVAQSIRRGALGQAAALVGRMARALLVHQYQAVFALSAADARRVPPVRIPGYSVEGLTDWETVRQVLYGSQADYQRHLPEDPERFCRQGACFWVGRLDGSVAAVGISRTHAFPQPYFIPFVPGQALLSHFVTLPAFRGRGLYRATLVHIMHSLVSQGTQGFVIDCADWNVASRCGIERAGFQRIGTGVIKRSGRMVWYPL